MFKKIFLFWFSIYSLSVAINLIMASPFGYWEIENFSLLWLFPLLGSTLFFYHPLYLLPFLSIPLIKTKVQFLTPRGRNFLLFCTPLIISLGIFFANFYLAEMLTMGHGLPTSQEKVFLIIIAFQVILGGMLSYAQIREKEVFFAYLTKISVVLIVLAVLYISYSFFYISDLKADVEKISNKAILDRNPNTCQLLDGKEKNIFNIRAAKKQFECVTTIAKEEGDISICEKVSLSWKRPACEGEVLRITSPCANISDIPEQNQCFKETAINSNNFKLCYALGSMEDTIDCFAAIAAKNEDPKICYEIPGAGNIQFTECFRKIREINPEVFGR